MYDPIEGDAHAPESADDTGPENTVLEWLAECYAAAGWLVEQGWICEKMGMKHQEGEDFRVMIVVRRGFGTMETL